MGRTLEILTNHFQYRKKERVKGCPLPKSSPAKNLFARPAPSSDLSFLLDSLPRQQHPSILALERDHNPLKRDDDDPTATAEERDNFPQTMRDDLANEQRFAAPIEEQIERFNRYFLKIFGGSDG